MHLNKMILIKKQICFQKDYIFKTSIDFFFFKSDYKNFLKSIKSFIRLFIPESSTIKVLKYEFDLGDLIEFQKVERKN